MNEQVTPGGPDYASSLPNLDQIYSADDAGLAIDKLNSQWASDPRHPLVDGSHILHQRFGDAMRELWKIKTAGMDDKTPLQRVMADAMENQQAGQEQRIGEAQELVSQLSEEFGWDHFTVPDDVLPHELDCIATLLQVEKGEWSEAIEQLDRAVVQFPFAPSEVHQALSQLRELNKGDGRNENHDEKRLASLVILQWLRDAGRAKLGLQPREPEGGADYGD